MTCSFYNWNYVCLLIRSKCNCDDLRNVECVLETKDLWEKFHDLETEMIITKTGRWGFSIKLEVTKMWFLYNRVCHGFRLTKREDYFWVDFDHFWSKCNFLRQLGQYWKSARANELQISTKLSLPKVKLTVLSVSRIQIEIIIFESLLTNFVANVIYLRQLRPYQ